MTYNEFMQELPKYQQNTPVDLEALAHALRLGVFGSFELPNTVSGMIVKANDTTRKYDKGSGYYIVVNQHQHEHRMRFTIAHEIAHFILDHDKIGDNLIDSALYRSDNVSEPEERAANALAADILMPWALISEELSKGVPVSSLAEKFDVSSAAMSVRLGIPLE